MKLFSVIAWILLVNDGMADGGWRMGSGRWKVEGGSKSPRPQHLKTSTPNAQRLNEYNVVWDTPSKDYGGSMPVGNGDIGANVWVEPNGDLLFYLSKTDAWDDNARLVKIGKVRVNIEPNHFIEGQPFRQTLNLQDGTLRVEAGKTLVQVWVDAHHPVVYVTVKSETQVEATASFELWRTKPFELAELQVSDVMLDNSKPDGKHAPTIIEPDTVLPHLKDRIGWYHHNAKSVGPKEMAELQGLTGFKQADPLLHRTFGAVITAAQGERLDDQHLKSLRETTHRFSVFVLTRHPATPEEWLAEMERTIARVEKQRFDERRAVHERWWKEFWNRSWIHVTPPKQTGPKLAIPPNKHPVRIGIDQHDGNQFIGTLGRTSLFAKALPEAEIEKLYRMDHQTILPVQIGLVFSSTLPSMGAIPDSAAWDFKNGFTIEAWINPDKLPHGGARIVDKVTPGVDDGFLFDTYPGNSLRLICGTVTLNAKDALPAGRWSHVVAVADTTNGFCRLYVNGKRVAESQPVKDEYFAVSQGYQLQRYVNACGGRGAYPIKFNGSIFTVPLPDNKSDPDYRRWGSGYWWQNTRLPYFSMPASGDFDLMKPLFQMYAGEVLKLCKYRTKLYLGHGGAYFPECIYFWGAVFSETYGWTPFEQRTDKLQESRWHKWEWVCGLELAWIMLDYYEHAQDKAFLNQTIIPFAREVLRFFDEHYPVDEKGKLVMHPSQSLETWWECTNPMPEIAGCRAVAKRLLALPADSTPSAERELYQRLLEKLPDLPTREIEGKIALAPAEKFERKQNVENPELYAVFPFRLIAQGLPNLEWGLEALKYRTDKGNMGWRQDDLFMAYLGLTEEVRQYVVGRARNHDQNSRFPAFWGPNYDWTPDQCHGGVLMKTLQAMMLQTDGKKIYLLPACPPDWDVDFKLHAPYQTTIECTYRNGKIEKLIVTPKERAKDVILPVGLSKP